MLEVEVLVALDSVLVDLVVDWLFLSSVEVVQRLVLVLCDDDGVVFVAFAVSLVSSVMVANMLPTML